MELKILKATEKDAYDISLLEAECFSVPWTEENITDSINSATVFYIAKQNGKTVGYLGMQNAMGDGYITNVAVTKDFRKKGVATALLSELFNYATKNSMNFISLEVRKSNLAAISLYQKLGFIDVGTRKNFYTAPKEDAVIMTKYFS